MFLRQYFRKANGQRIAYWALVESNRTERGPRQRVVSWFGLLDEAGRLGVQQAAKIHAASNSLPKGNCRYLSLRTNQHSPLGLKSTQVLFAWRIANSFAVKKAIT